MENSHIRLSGNPVGVANATAVATVLWPDGTTGTEQETTSRDGVAVFTVPLRSSALNHLVLVQMTFTSPDGVTCSIPQAAYFARDSRESDTIRIAFPWLPPAKMWHTDCEPNCDKEAGKMKCSRLSLPVRPAVHHQGTDVANVGDEAA